MSGGMEDTAKLFGVWIQCRVCGYSARTKNPSNRDCPFCACTASGKLRFTMKEIEGPESDFNPRPWIDNVEYYSAEGIDIRDVIEAFGLNYNLGAVAKYIFRRKPGNTKLMDLKKAREHINREIKRLEAPKMDHSRKNPDPELRERGTEHHADNDGA